MSKSFALEDPLLWAETVVGFCDENERELTSTKESLGKYIDERNELLNAQNKIKKNIAEIKLKISQIQ